MDIKVFETQAWLNKTYKKYDGYKEIDEDGVTGNGTIGALTIALQIELGITSGNSTNFGPTTIQKFKEKFPNGIQEQKADDKSTNNIYGIIEGALWCKGYYGNTSLENVAITKHFYFDTAASIIQLKEEAGLVNPTSTVELDVMQALLSMTQFRIIGDETQEKINIREIQQALNKEYREYIGLSACDGLYNRQMNTSMIKALQVIEGSTGSNVDGIFGSGTKAKLPILPDNSGKLSNQNRKRAINLLVSGLYCNGYTNIDISQTEWNEALANAVITFQKDNLLSADGIVGADVWMALLLSTGNPDRACNACDTRFRMWSTPIEYLKSQNYIAVGRYLTGGTFKQLNKEEPKALIDSGIGIFCIFQEGQSRNFFTSENGKIDASSAIHAAKKYGIPNNNIIYFAVDYDATEDDIKNYIAPYFKAVKDTMSSYGSPFKIGIYGTRNVCQKIIDLGYAESAYLSSISTGFSGNLGFKKPDKWNLDQFASYSIDFPGYIPLDFDKVAYRGLIEPVKSLESPSSNGHAYLRAGSDDYYLGTAKNIGREGSTGVYFTALCNKIGIKALLNMVQLPEDEPAGNFRMAIYLQEYNSDDPEHPIEIKEPFLYLKDGELSAEKVFDVIPGLDYKLRYELRDVGSTEEQTTTVSCDVDVYISTYN